jgi:hypothetical protein
MWVVCLLVELSHSLWQDKANFLAMYWVDEVLSYGVSRCECMLSKWCWVSYHGRWPSIATYLVMGSSRYNRRCVLASALIALLLCVTMYRVTHISWLLLSM